MERRLTFGYGRALLVSRATFSAIILAFVAIALTFLPPVDPLALAALLAVVAAYVLVFTVSPLWTVHWLTRSRLILRQGLYFRTIVPMTEIEDIGPADVEGSSRVPLGVHRPLGQSTLYVTGGRTGLVRLRLRAPRRFWQAFGLQATSIVFDVAELTKFLDAAEERFGLLPPVQADRTDA